MLTTPFILLLESLLIGISVVLFFGAKLRRKRAITAWRQALSLDQHEAVFQKLYAEVNGFALSQEARRAQDAIEYVYGEIEFDAFIALLSLCHPNSTTVFYDLGSGTGKAVLACAMVFDVKKSCGIELFSSLDQCARLQKEHLKQIPGYFTQSNCIELRQGDFLEGDFNEASLIFINATAFFGEVWTAICKRLEQINSDTLVITTSKALKSSLFKTLKTTKVQMSWGVVDAFIQQRL